MNSPINIIKYDNLKTENKNYKKLDYGIKSMELQQNDI